ncbi:MAG: hypothetical protein ABIQ74_00835 [Chitinophagales bacterium]
MQYRQEHCQTRTTAQKPAGPMECAVHICIAAKAEHYRFCEQQITRIDAHIVAIIEERMKKSERASGFKNYTPLMKKQLQFNDIKPEASPMIYTLSNGVDLGVIWGVGNNLVMTLLSELGLDLKQKFKAEKHFVS